MRRLATIVLLTAAGFSSVAVAIPEWAKKQGQSLAGSIYKVACSGDGPSVDIARNEAIQSCKASAAQMLVKETKVRSLSVETQSDVAYHQEVAETVNARNLTCNPEKEEIESTDGAFRVWVLCRFNLDQVDVVSEPSTPPTAKQSSSNAHLGSVKSAEFKPQTSLVRVEKSVINIVTVPQCSDLLIRGGRPRSLQCVKSPMQVSLDARDESIIVRANGYKPKTIDLSERSRWSEREIIQVILESH